MKRLLLAIFAITLTNCVSTKKYNATIYEPISANDLQKDVDFIYKKLKKLHPKLYLYISEKELDQKFDSLKRNINQPMNSYQFYTHLAPVLSEIKQGHIFSAPRTLIINKKMKKKLKEKGTGPFSQIDFEIFDKKLFITKDQTKQKDIRVGTEVLSINSIDSKDLLQSAKSLYSSDGFNKTFYNHYWDEFMTSNFTYQFGLQDSLTLHLKWNDSTYVKVIKRENTDIISTKSKKGKKINDKEKDSIKKAKKFDDIHGFNPEKKEYNRMLRFQDADSCIAVMEIKSFTLGDYEEFYKQSFQKLKEKEVTHLILDFRNNGGGQLADCTELYSYLTPDFSFVMIDKQFVTKKTSMWNIPVYSRKNGIYNVLLTPLLPLFYATLYFKTFQDENGNYYFDTKFSKLAFQNPNAFNGKVYTMINGASFSATSIISSHLSATNRAYFVGEETGGDYNGTIAGTMPFFTLPHSKVKVRFGLQLIAPTVKTRILGRGIFPDKKIIPTLQDRIDGKDPEMEWILNEIKK